MTDKTPTERKSKARLEQEYKNWIAGGGSAFTSFTSWRNRQIAKEKARMERYGW